MWGYSATFCRLIVRFDTLRRAIGIGIGIGERRTIERELFFHRSLYKKCQLSHSICVRIRTDAVG